MTALVDGIWAVLERDERVQRVYFDLASQSVVEPRVREIMREMKEDFRAILRELLRGLDDGPPRRDLDAAAVYLVAGIEGLSLEWLDRGETAELEQAKELFVRSAATAIRANGRASA